MKIYLLLAEHATVPGVHVSAHKTPAGRKAARDALRKQFKKDVTFEEFEADLAD